MSSKSVGLYVSMDSASRSERHGALLEVDRKTGSEDSYCSELSNRKVVVRNTGEANAKQKMREPLSGSLGRIAFTATNNPGNMAKEVPIEKYACSNEKRA